MAKLKTIVDKLQREKDRDRGKITVYVDRQLYKEFQTRCKTQQVSVSRVLEELMREFLAETAKD